MGRDETAAFLEGQELAAQAMSADDQVIEAEVLK